MERKRNTKTPTKPQTGRRPCGSSNSSSSHGGPVAHHRPALPCTCVFLERVGCLSIVRLHHISNQSTDQPTQQQQVWDVNAHPNPTLGELGERLPTYSLLDYERDTGVGVAGYVVGAE